MPRNTAATTIFKFRLYVAGDAPNSEQAREHLRALCREYLQDRHEIEIIDVFRHPQRALVDRIFMTPTLVKLAPLPGRRIVGTLGDRHAVLLALGLGPLRP